MLVWVYCVNASLRDSTVTVDRHTLSSSDPVNSSFSLLFLSGEQPEEFFPPHIFGIRTSRSFLSRVPALTSEC